MTTTYKIMRNYFDDSKEKRTLRKGLTLEEARAHCKDPETDSRTATTAKGKAHTAMHGPWFDGYEEES